MLLGIQAIKNFTSDSSFAHKMYHLLLLTKISQAKSSYSNRNLCDQEFCVRAKKFPMQILMVLKMVMHIQCVDKRKLLGLKMNSVCEA